MYIVVCDYLQPETTSGPGVLIVERVAVDGRRWWFLILYSFLPEHTTAAFAPDRFVEPPAEEIESAQQGG